MTLASRHVSDDSAVSQSLLAEWFPKKMLHNAAGKGFRMTTARFHQSNEHVFCDILCSKQESVVVTNLFDVWFRFGQNVVFDPC